MSEQRKQHSGHLFKNNIVFIVTGASKGLGKAIVQCFVDRFVAYHSLSGAMNQTVKLSLILLARDEQLLNELKADVEARSKVIEVVKIIAGDLKENGVIKRFGECLENLQSNFDEAVIIHNAGSLGDPTMLVEQYSLQHSEYLSAYFEFNVLSAMKMTALFINAFKKKAKHQTIVNITSGVTFTAYKGLSLYATGKAAREAYFRNVAIETTNTSVLNYSPSAVQTDMTEMMKHKGYYKEKFSQEGFLISPEESAKCLFNILDSGKYENGAHVRYSQS